MTTQKSIVCTKCGGSGKLDWTDNDGGICYKCEGKGYIGEMPEGFNKSKSTVIEKAKMMVTSYFSKVRFTNPKNSFCLPSYELDSLTAKEMASRQLVLRYKYDKFFMALPDMIVPFGGGWIGDIKYYFTIQIGKEFVEIRANKTEE